MEHISSAVPKVPEKINPLNLLRERLPKIADLPDEVIRPYAGELWDASKCKMLCKGCTGFETCWRDGDGRGVVTVARVHEGQIKIENMICPQREAYEQRERQQRLLRDSGMTEDERGFTFENFPPEQYRRHRRIVDTAREFAETYDGEGKQSGMYFFGPPGIAKTHLMLAILNRLNDRGIPAVFIRTDDLVDRLRTGKGEGDFDEVLDRYMTVPVLGIDELAQERTNDFSLESVLRILNARAQKSLPTFFTSNYMPTAIYERHYGEHTERIDALRSRVYKSAIPARMIGEDYRMNNLDFAMGPDEEV